MHYGWKAAIAVGFTLVSSLSALAADMPVKSVSPAPYNWTGLYVGLNAGYGRCGSPDCSPAMSGGIAGGQIGYNWQVNQIVFGVEADAQAAWIKQTSTLGGVTTEAKNNSNGTVRGRLGYAVGPALIYGTGGWAWANNEVSATLGGVTASAKFAQYGYAAGGGLEYAFAPKWSTKVEYLYNHFQSVNVLGVPSGDLNLHAVKLGINYRFY
ncbi:MAG TPA: outer membrane protein [Pseudolabrys sp.]|nr:outer membrane protein [Pseudolabrys sp.]